MSDRPPDTPPEEEVETTVDEEQQAMVEPAADKLGGAVGAVSEPAGEAVRDAFAEGEQEATPFIALTTVMILVGTVVAIVIALIFVVYLLNR